jgi:hypothetical protein
MCLSNIRFTNQQTPVLIACCAVCCGLACQALKEQELVLAERKQALDAATAAAERQQRELAAREAGMSAAATKLEQQQAAAIAASDEIDRQRKAIEAARRGLAGVEAALDAREAQLAESWGQLAANAAALKAGELDGVSLRASVSAACCWQTCWSHRAGAVGGKQVWTAALQQACVSSLRSSTL